MKRRLARGTLFVVLCAGASISTIRGEVLGQEYEPKGASAGRRFGKAITDKDVEGVGLAVRWKALCMLGEHARPTAIYVFDQEVLVTDTFTRLSSFDAKDGRSRWVRALDRPLQPISEPAVDGQDLFVVAAGHLISMDRRFGAERWRIRLKNIPAGGPAVAGDFVYVAGSDGWLYAFSRIEQKEMWFFNARSSLTGKPVPVGTEGQLLVFVADQNNRIYCLSNKERKIIWQDRTQEPVVAPPARIGRYLYLACSDFNVYALDASEATPDKRLRWTFMSGSQVLASPVAIGATVYFPSLRNGFYAVRRLNGKPRWWRATGVRLLSVGKRRCYLLDEEGAILVVNKLNGSLEGRYVVPKDYRWLGTNVHTEALYLLNRDGLLVCLREKDIVLPEQQAPAAP